MVSSKGADGETAHRRGRGLSGPSVIKKRTMRRNTRTARSRFIEWSVPPGWPALARSTSSRDSGGRLVVPVGSRCGTQELLLIEKESSGALRTTRIALVRFVPLLREPRQD